MRKLTTKEIESFASRKDVRKIAVENFLMSMGTIEVIAKANAIYDEGLYGWNKKTVDAIFDGIELASKD